MMKKETCMVTIAVKGTLTIPVAPGPVPLMRKEAESKMIDVDLGCLENVDWSSCEVETPTGQLIDLHVEPYPELELLEPLLDELAEQPDLGKDRAHTADRICKALQLTCGFSEIQAKHLVRTVAADLEKDECPKARYYQQFKTYLDRYLSFVEHWDNDPLAMEKEIPEWICGLMQGRFGTDIGLIRLQSDWNHHGWFRIQFRYHPKSYQITFEGEFHSFTVRITADDGGFIDLEQIVDYSGQRTLSGVQEAVEKLKTILDKELPFYKVIGGKRYQLIGGRYKRIQNRKDGS